MPLINKVDLRCEEEVLEVITDPMGKAIIIMTGKLRIDPPFKVGRRADQVS